MKDSFQDNLDGIVQTQPSTQLFKITKVYEDDAEGFEDALAVEEPLEIRLLFGPSGEKQTKSISVTMRTPGHDEELATGFLFTEGIVAVDTKMQKSDVFLCAEGKGNTITLSLPDAVKPNLQQADRNFYTTSSCGVCGKSSIASIHTHQSFIGLNPNIHINRALIYSLPAKLSAKQAVFKSTGGIHACGLFNTRGELLLLHEDVGRHNALDKLIGRGFLDGLLPFDDHILLLSGRASFELIQKAAMAGIFVIVAIGAPSSLAVNLAKSFNITLIGFLRNQKFNIYSVPERIK